MHGFQEEGFNQAQVPDQPQKSMDNILRNKMSGHTDSDGLSGQSHPTSCWAGETQLGRPTWVSQHIQEGSVSRALKEI